jgi:hypothetical protein
VSGSTVSVPRDLLEQVIAALNRNFMELPSQDEFIPTGPHECDDECKESLMHDGAWVTRFGQHPLAKRLGALASGTAEGCGLCYSTTASGITLTCGACGRVAPESTP